jgi:AraC-like DNA-binding protein
MEIPFDIITFIYLAGTVLGVVSGLVILYQSIKVNPANMPLAIGQIVLALAIWVVFAVVTKLMIQWPFLFRAGSLLGLVFVPLPLLNLQFHTQKRSWKWYDCLHFIPALVYLVDFWPIFTLSNQQKVALILRDINDQNQFALLRESRFFPPGFHQTFRVLMVNVYWLVQCRILYRWIKKETNLNNEEKIWKNWAMVFLFFQAGLWLPYYLTFIWVDKTLTFHMVYTSAAAWLVLSSVLLLFYPSLLYGHQPAITNQKGKKSKQANGEQRAANEADVQKMEEVKKAIDQSLNAQALFLKPGFTINECSKDIGIPVYQISRCITYYSGMGFTDFINQKRIEYCVQKLESGEWKHFKVEAIALECGFNNRNSFTNAFKKFKGISPSEYKASLDSVRASQ